MVFGDGADHATVARSCANISMLVVATNFSKNLITQTSSCYDVVHAVLTHADRDVALKGSEAIGRLAGISVEGKLRLIDEGACQALVGALKAYSADKTVVVQACQAMTELGNGVDENNQFGRAGACEVLARALETYQDDPDTAAEVVYAIYVIATNDDNYKALDEAGVLDMLFKLLPRYQSHLTFCQGAVGVLRNFTMPDEYAIKLGGMGLCKLLVDTVDKHRGDSIVVKDGIAAMGNFMGGMPPHFAMMGDAGACEVAMRALNDFAQDPAIVQMCALTIVKLATVEQFRPTLLSLGAEKALKNPLAANIAPTAMRVLHHQGPYNP